jgi:hypothetical protein
MFRARFLKTGGRAELEVGWGNACAGQSRGREIADNRLSHEAFPIGPQAQYGGQGRAWLVPEPSKPLIFGTFWVGL